MSFLQSKSVKIIGNLAVWALLVVVPLTVGAMVNRKDGAQQVQDCIEKALAHDLRKFPPAKVSASVADVAWCVNQVE